MDIGSFIFGTGMAPSQKYYSKNIGDYQMIIYVGMWTVLGSVPIDPDLDINQYTTVGLEVLSSKGVILNAFEASCLKLDKLGLTPVFWDASYRDVSVAQIEAVWIILENEAKSMNNFAFQTAVGQFANANSILDDLLESSIEEDDIILEEKDTRVGGNCSVCGSYDDWACWKNNRAYCYKHTVGY
jgi:hypothetical protein